MEALLLAGLDQKTIAKNLELSTATVSRYCKKIREKIASRPTVSSR
ncbi:LuxR C-terminal-related transcriptional regulator [Pseudomonas sp. PDM29]